MNGVWLNQNWKEHSYLLYSEDDDLILEAFLSIFTYLILLDLLGIKHPSPSPSPSPPLSFSSHFIICFDGACEVRSGVVDQQRCGVIGMEMGMGMGMANHSHCCEHRCPNV